MAQISISEAAKLVGKDRKTLYKAIKDGRLSATLSATGGRQVDTSELQRVYGNFIVAVDSRATVETPQETTPNATALLSEIKRLEGLLAAKDANLEDLRSTIRLVEYAKEKATSNTPSKRRQWWRFWK